MEILLLLLERNKFGRKMFVEGISGRHKKFDSQYFIFKTFVRHLNRTL